MDEGHPLDPSTPYAASKAGADHVVSSYARTFGLDVVTVRPFNAFGPRQNDGAYAGVIPVVVRRALAGEPVIVDGDGEQTRDFTFVGEIAEAAVRLYACPSARGLAVNVSSGEEVSVNALVAALLAAVDADVPVVHGPARPGDVRRHCGSPALVESLTGFRPRSRLDTGLAETVRWYRETAAVGGVGNPH
jgi:UDP-glucose 4-epimerase